MKVEFDLKEMGLYGRVMAKLAQVIPEEEDERKINLAIRMTMKKRFVSEGNYLVHRTRGIGFSGKYFTTKNISQISKALRGKNDSFMSSTFDDFYFTKYAAVRCDSPYIRELMDYHLSNEDDINFRFIEWANQQLNNPRNIKNGIKNGGIEFDYDRDHLNVVFGRPPHWSVGNGN